MRKLATSLFCIVAISHWAEARAQSVEINQCVDIVESACQNGQDAFYNYDYITCVEQELIICNASPPPPPVCISDSEGRQVCFYNYNR